MAVPRSAKGARRRKESAEVGTRDDWDDAVLKEGDRVLIASIDSFPASDPPGWIEVAACPREASSPPVRKR